jgi:hypothetical protein
MDFVFSKCDIERYRTSIACFVNRNNFFPDPSPPCQHFQLLAGWCTNTILYENTLIHPYGLLLSTPLGRGEAYCPLGLETGTAVDNIPKRLYKFF